MEKIIKVAERIVELEEALLDMLRQFGYNYALSAVENACKVLDHPIKEGTDRCFCLNKKRGDEKMELKDSKELPKTIVELWVIYDHPSDYPDKFVARKFIFDKPTDDVKTADTLEEIRALLPKGLFLMDRDPSDDPVIKESWL